VSAQARSTSHILSTQYRDVVQHQVEKKVKSILEYCKDNYVKFFDADFGPNDEDEYGAKSLYGNPPVLPGSVGGSKYPKPDSLRWDRPRYATTEFSSSDGEDDQVNGALDTPDLRTVAERK
jgi:hypothetical protein